MSTPPERTRGSSLAWIGTIFHAGLVLALFVYYIALVPSAKRTFDEYGLTLPLMTQQVLRISAWLAEYWWAVATVCAVLGVMDFTLIRHFYQQSGFAFPVLWIIGIALPLVVIGIGTVVAIELPMMKLREGLAH